MSTIDLADYTVEMKKILSMGAKIQTKNENHHWIITYGKLRIDFWPSSERFQITRKSEVLRGLNSMMGALQNETTPKKE